MLGVLKYFDVEKLCMRGRIGFLDVISNDEETMKIRILFISWTVLYKDGILARLN